MPCSPRLLLSSALAGLLATALVAPVHAQGPQLPGKDRGSVKRVDDKADPGTIRGDFGMSVSFNLVHGSDSEQTAQNELALFFSESGELVEWTADNSSWIYDLEDLAQRA